MDDKTRKEAFGNMVKKTIKVYDEDGHVKQRSYKYKDKIDQCPGCYKRKARLDLELDDPHLKCKKCEEKEKYEKEMEMRKEKIQTNNKEEEEEVRTVAMMRVKRTRNNDEQVNENQKPK